MRLHTVRFGSVEVDESLIVTFSTGLPGFGNLRRFAMLWADAREIFWWLQSVEDPAICFLATDPGLWVADYAVDLRPEDLVRLGLRRSEDAVVLALVSRHGDRITANLRAPLVLDAASRRGLQLVSAADSPWGLRHDLAHVEAPALAGIA